MKNGMTIEDYLKDLEQKKERAEAYESIINHIDNEIKWKCEREIETEGYYEDIVNEDTGEAERKWHSTVYKTDADGEYIWIEPNADGYNYKSYMAFKKVREEIMAII